MNRVQIIEHNGKPAFAVVPIKLWQRLLEASEEAVDLAALERFDREDDGVRYPAPVAYAMADGVSPVCAWREHRAMTLQALAEAAGLSKPYVRQIEGSKRTGTAVTLEKLARALGVPMEALQP